jgi:hypothetical protein
MFNTAMLEPGKTYAFRTKEWCGPTTAVIPGAIQSRRFLGLRTLDFIRCIEVERASGKVHLIAADAIEGASPVQFPD